MTVSNYLATLVSRSVGGEWPAGYLERVVGSCVDAPLTEPGELLLDDVELVVR